MVVDTSAILAIFFLEDEAERFADEIETAEGPLISVVSVIEAAIVLRVRKWLEPDEADRRLDAFLASGDFRIEPVTLAHMYLAREADRRFGKGTGHPARLNFGDCFSYALARERNLPLLFKGDDFALTDVSPAVRA